MAHTNAWDETTPLGSENASTSDDYFRKHRLDLGERLEDMFYGFNAASNAAPENDYGIKSLKFYKQTSDPTAATDYSHVYVKLVDGVPELFYQDDENTTIQLTSGGDLYSSAGLSVAVNAAIAGTLNVTGATEVTGVATLGDASLLKTSAAPTTDAMIANKKYVNDYAAAIDDIFGTISTVDSDANAFVDGHAYSAPTAGIVVAWVDNSGTAPWTLTGYIGATNDPAGAGTIAAYSVGYVQENRICITFSVAKDEYWEFVTGHANTTATATWRPIGTLSAPVDQD